MKKFFPLEFFINLFLVSTCILVYSLLVNINSIISPKMNHAVRDQLLQQLYRFLLTHPELEPDHLEEGGLPPAGELHVLFLPQGL